METSTPMQGRATAKGLALPWTKGKETVEPSPDATGSVVVTRLVARRPLDGLALMVVSLRLRRATLRSPGALGVALLAQPLRGTYWTLSAWRDETSLRDFVRGDAHRTAAGRHRHRMASFDTARLPLPPDGATPSWADATAALDGPAGDRIREPWPSTPRRGRHRGPRGR